MRRSSDREETGNRFQAQLRAAQHRLRHSMRTTQLSRAIAPKNLRRLRTPHWELRIIAWSSPESIRSRRSQLRPRFESARGRPRRWPASAVRQPCNLNQEESHRGGTEPARKCLRRRNHVVRKMTSTTHFDAVDGVSSAGASEVTRQKTFATPA